MAKNVILSCYYSALRKIFHLNTIALPLEDLAYKMQQVLQPVTVPIEDKVKTAGFLSQNGFCKSKSVMGVIMDDEKLIHKNLIAFIKLIKKQIPWILMAIFLVGCGHTLSEVENKFGPPARVEKETNTITYYYYYQKRGYMGVIEFTAKPDGKIINTRKYRTQGQPIVAIRPEEHRRYIREGIFISGLNQLSFLEEWGKPDKQGVWSESGGRFRVAYSLTGTQSGTDQAGQLFNDVWIYYKQNKILFFSNYRLVAHYDWHEYQKTEREEKKLPPITK